MSNIGYISVFRFRPVIVALERSSDHRRDANQLAWLEANASKETGTLRISPWGAVVGSMLRADRGLLALVGLAFAGLVVVKFMLPALAFDTSAYHHDATQDAQRA